MISDQWINIFVKALLLVCAATPSFAAQSASRSSAGTLAKQSLLIGGGLDTRLERNVEQKSVFRSAPQLSLGFLAHDFVFIFEASQFNLSSGSGNLQIDRRSESLMLNTLWHPDHFSLISPYLSFALGAMQESAEVQLDGESNHARSQWDLLAGLGAGARLFPWTRIWFSPEFRLLFSEAFQSSPQISAQLRFGLLF